MTASPSETDAAAHELLKRLLAPDRCTVLVVDKQRWYLDPTVSPYISIDDADASDRSLLELRKMDDFISRARTLGVTVAWTLMEEGAEDAPANVSHRWERRPDEPRLRRGDGGHLVAGSTGPAPGEGVFTKAYPDAFSAPDLTQGLRSNGCTTVVIIGGYAGRCVLATAFGAQTHGFDVVVPRDLVTPHPNDPDEERVFERVIDSVVGYVLAPEEILRIWHQRTSISRQK